MHRSCIHYSLHRTFLYRRLPSRSSSELVYRSLLCRTQYPLYLALLRNTLAFLSSSLYFSASFLNYARVTCGVLQTCRTLFCIFYRTFGGRQEAPACIVSLTEPYDVRRGEVEGGKKEQENEREAKNRTGHAGYWSHSSAEGRNNAGALRPFDIQFCAFLSSLWACRVLPSPLH